MKSIIAFLIVSVVLCASATSGDEGRYNPVYHESQDQQHDEETQNEYHRSCKIEKSTRELQVESVGTSSNADKLELHVNAAVGAPATFRFKYFTNTNKTVTETYVKLSFREIFEYQETSTMFDGFTFGVDPVVKTIDFSEQQELNSWRIIPNPTQTNLSSGEKIYQFKISYPHPSDPVNKDIVVLHLTISEAIYTIANITYPANSIKVDVEIKDWVFTNENNYLGITTQIQSKQERNRWANYADREGQIGTISVGGNDGDGAPKVLFNWLGKLTADGVEVPVIASSLMAETQLLSEDSQEKQEQQQQQQQQQEQEQEQETANKMFFSFNAPNCSQVYWDPSFGTSDALEFALPGIFISFLMLFISLF